MQHETSQDKGFFTVFKGAGLALAVSLLLAIIFACILRIGRLPDNIIYPVNQVLKGVSVALGALVCVRGEKGWLKGGGIGVLYSAFSYLAFSALGGDFSLSWLIFLELFIVFLTGALGGMLAVNCKK